VLHAVPHLREQLAENGLEFIKHPSYSNYERLTRPLLKIAYSSRRIPTLGEILPSGFFDNRQLESFMARNMKRNKMPNNFRVIKRMTGKSLYIAAMDLDTSERVFFGPDEKNDVSISEAVQASTAIPGFYKPARIKGVDYVDGGVRKTAHIDFAFEKGADLVICYNPFKPYNNKIFLEYIREDNKYITRNKRISDYGLGTILNQVFRTVFHSRLQLGLKNLANDPNFKKDVIVIEPDEDYNDITTLNPLFFWNRAKAAKIGFDSVATTIERHFDELARVLAAYGIQISRDQVDHDMNAIKNSNNEDQVIMDILENPSQKEPANSGSLKVLRGGRN
jgi:predicted acylesterase/phospholipase RssA